MSEAANRQLRERIASLESAIDRVGPPSVSGTPRLAVQVYDGGAMPTAADRFYLTHPVSLDGDEVEGGTATVVADATQTIPVVFLGGVPVVGDVVTAFAVGGRWVAERGRTSVGSCCIYPCLPCSIPRKDLTIAWVNPLAGNGSDTLVYTAPGTWATGCSGGAGVGNQLLFKLFCTGGQIELRAYYFVSGSCPTGQSNYCSNLRTVGSQLIPDSHTCSPFSMAFTETTLSCPTITGSGFTSFTITDPSPVGPQCCMTICVGCNGGISGLADATVTVSRGMTTVFTGVTPASGCLLARIGAAGSYTVIVSKTGYTTVTTILTLSCCASASISLYRDYRDNWQAGGTVTDPNFFPGGLAATYTADPGTIFAPLYNSAGSLMGLPSPCLYAIGSSACIGTVGYVLFPWGCSMTGRMIEFYGAVWHLLDNFPGETSTWSPLYDSFTPDPVNNIWGPCGGIFYYPVPITWSA